jgi:hypothetical protein
VELKARYNSYVTIMNTTTEPSIEQVEAELRLAAQILDRCAGMIRDVPIEPRGEHIKRIGTALANVFDIQHAIYGLRPDLMPASLKETPARPADDAELSVAYLAAKKAEDDGNVSSAIRAFEDFLLVDRYALHRRIAEAEIERLKSKKTT